LAAVETVADLRGRSFRRVAVEFTGPVDPGEFARIPGVTGAETDGARLTLRAHDGLDAVVKAVARHTVVDLEVSEPTLEEVFLTFYAGAGRT
jgi:ABC-2 type transport system ATP-binding protein